MQREPWEDSANHEFCMADGDDGECPEKDHMVVTKLIVANSLLEKNQKQHVSHSLNRVVEGSGLIVTESCKSDESPARISEQTEHGSQESSKQKWFELYVRRHSVKGIAVA